MSVNTEFDTQKIDNMVLYLIDWIYMINKKNIKKKFKNFSQSWIQTGPIMFLKFGERKKCYAIGKTLYNL